MFFYLFYNIHYDQDFGIYENIKRKKKSYLDSFYGNGTKKSFKNRKIRVSTYKMKKTGPNGGIRNKPIKTTPRRMPPPRNKNAAIGSADTVAMEPNIAIANASRKSLLNAKDAMISYKD